MTGRQFEELCVKKLHEAGFWVHRIHPDESGQQPFDIIAANHDKICAYDAKVISDTQARKFSINRIEDNQINAMRLFAKKTGSMDVGFLIHVDGTIKFLELERINSVLWLGGKSVDVRFLREWRP